MFILHKIPIFSQILRSLYSKIPIKYQENTKKVGTEIPNNDLVLFFSWYTNFLLPIDITTTNLPLLNCAGYYRSNLGMYVVCTLYSINTITSKTPCLAMNERARKSFWCGFNAKAERFPRQRNWRRKSEYAVTLPPTLVSRYYWASSHTSILAKLVNRILRYGTGGEGCTCARAEMPHPTHDLWKART